MTSNFSKRIVIVELICGLFILLFVYSAISKLLDYDEFKKQLRQSPLLTAFANWAAVFIPVLEVTLSVFLGSRRFRLLSLYGSFSLMTMFSGYIIAITNFADYIPCSCGGVLENFTWSEHLIFNCMFTGLAAIAVIIYPLEK